jgi:transcriptional regulator with XRE-family HTH domain
MDDALRARSNLLRAALRKLRLAKGLRQVDLAQLLGEPQSFVSKFESGERRLYFVDVERICGALGVTLLEFVRDFTGEGKDAPV